jgi:tetratricopeptide (TPR) repeat protein
VVSVLSVKRSLLLAALLCLSGCRHRAGLPADESLFQQGLAAFREATPEGYTRAIAAFRSAVNLEPSRCDYSMHLAQSLLFLAQEQQSNWEEFLPRVSEAKTVVEAIASNAPCSDSFVARVRALDRGSEALASINRAIELDARDPLNWVVLAYLKPDDARQPALRAVELAADLAVVQSTLGQFYLDTGKFAEAKQAFSKAAEISPRHFRSITSLGYLANLEDSPETESLYLKAVNIAPTFLSVRVMLGAFYAGIGTYDKAVEHYRAAIAQNERYSPALIGLGRTLIYAGRLEEAEAPLQQVVQINPMSPQITPERAAALSDARYLLGHLRVIRADAATAKTEFQEALRAARNVDAMSALGGVYYREGDLTQALRQYESVIQFEKGLKVPHDFPEAYLYRGAIRAVQQKVPDAIEDFSHAIEVYERQIADLTAQAVKSESLGLPLKAQLERQQRGELEKQLQLSRELREKTLH